MQTATKALEQARTQVRRGFDQGYPVDSVAGFIEDVGPDVDARLWVWWMTMHKPDDRPKDERAYRRYYERVYEELENLWSRRR